MWHTIFIATHAGTGGIALLAGCVTIARRALFGIYFGALIAMEVFLMLAIAAQWAAIDTPARILFSAFALLGLLMVWRANQARRTPLGRGYVGFTLVALFDAFIVVLVLNLGEYSGLTSPARHLRIVRSAVLAETRSSRAVSSNARSRSLSDQYRSRINPSSNVHGAASSRRIVIVAPCG